MNVKILAIVLALSLVSTTHALKCYTCNAGMVQTEDSCMDPKNTGLEPSIRLVECEERQTICVTEIYPHNIRRSCAIAMVNGQPFCNRLEEVPAKCTTCESDSCNSEKAGVGTVTVSSALFVTLVGFLFILYQ